eukprot:scaffold421_cov382-Prasinococcus_capsulatus_cf.AAC.6
MRRPHGKPISTLTILQHVGSMPFRFGFSCFKRLLEANDWFESTFKEVTEGKDCIELERMAVHPDFQRRGVGSHFLRQALEQAQAEVCLAPAALFGPGRTRRRGRPCSRARLSVLAGPGCLSDHTGRAQCAILQPAGL